MDLLRQLLDEHLLIDEVAGSLVNLAGSDEATVEDLAPFLEFFRVFVLDFHHRAEDEVLFETLVDRAEVPADRGPVAILGDEHRRMAELVERLGEEGLSDMGRRTARRLAHLVWEHVDKEGSVEFPEAGKRLARGGVRELAGRDAGADVESARRLGRSLVETWPPVDDPTVVRGDGCISCSAFAESCSGIEKEWWNTWEWQHFRSMDEG